VDCRILGSRNPTLVAFIASAKCSTTGSQRVGSNARRGDLRGFRPPAQTIR
jgi:hypothetical protein